MGGDGAYRRGPGDPIVRRDVWRGRPVVGWGGNVVADTDDLLLLYMPERGRWTQDEVDAIRAEGARVAADLDAGRRWWSDDWARWAPDSAWQVPELPPGWESV